MAPEKCSYLIFSKNRKTFKDEWFDLEFGNSKIKNDSQEGVKFLGITLDRLCNFDKQILNLNNKLTNRISIIKHLSYKPWGLTKQTLTNVYKSIVRSVIEYTSMFIGVMPMANKKKLEIPQNKCLRLIHKLTYRNNNNIMISNSELLVKTNMPSIEERSTKLAQTYICNGLDTGNELIKSLIEQSDKLKSINPIGAKQTLLGKIESYSPINRFH